jgi:hypothetical protein
MLRETVSGESAKTLSLDSNQMVWVSYSKKSVILCFMSERKVIVFKLGEGKGKEYLLYST